MKLCLSMLLAIFSVACSEQQSSMPEQMSLKTAELFSAADDYAERCAQCHDNLDVMRAPNLQALAELSVSQVIFSMTNGSMKPHADGLTLEAQFELADFITDGREPYQPEVDLFCEDRDVSTTGIIDRWGFDNHNSGRVPAGASRLTQSNISDLQLAWVFGLPNTTNARSQPVITEDTLFIAATSGHLFALDRHSGCIRWHQMTVAPPRTALTLGSIGSGEDRRVALFYGDLEANVVAVDAKDGEVIWRRPVGISEKSLLTGAIIQHEDRLIVPVSLQEVILATDPAYECCRSHGAVVALDADSGEQLWQFHTTPDATVQGHTSVGTTTWGPSGAPVWSTPTVDEERNLIYIGTGQNASLPATELSDSVLAIDMNSGQLAWHFQAIAGDVYNGACDQRPPGPNCPKWRGPDHDIGASVVLTKRVTGEDILLVGQKSGDIYGLDPDAQGELMWHERFGAGSMLGGVHWGLATDGQRLFVPIADPAFPIPGYFPAPGLYAVDIEDGDEFWSQRYERGCKTSMYEYFDREAVYPECSFYFGLSAAPSVVNDLVFAPSLNGNILAFAAESGELVWQFATVRPFESINRVTTHGGSIDVTRVLAVGDMIYVQSGYSVFGQLPGNALLAFRLPTE